MSDDPYKLHKLHKLQNENARKLVAAVLRNLTEEQREHVIGMAL